MRRPKRTVSQPRQTEPSANTAPRHTHHGSVEPHVYPRRILLAVTGLSPQFVTETIDALAVAGRPAFQPTEVHLLTTVEGKRNAELSLLAGDAWLGQLCDEYDLHPHCNTTRDG